MPTLNENIHQAIDDFDNIKSAIIEKGVAVPIGTSTSDYGEKIKEIETGTTPTGTINITENGSHDVTNYATADVEVPQPSGKTVIWENGTDINIAQYALADVNVNINGIVETTFETTFLGDYSCYGVDYDVTQLKEKNSEYVITLPQYDSEQHLLEGIGGNAFNGNDLVTWIRCAAPSNYTHVGSYAFNNCKNLRYIELRDVSSPADYAFANTPALNYVYFRNLSDVNISYYCFNFSGIKEIQCRAVDSFGFSYCSRLKTVEVQGDNISQYLVSVGANAFSHCSSLETLILGHKLIGATSGVKLLANSLNINDSTFTLENFVIQPRSTIIDENGVCGNTTLTINNVYFGGSESDYNTWISTLNDTDLVTALNGATKHYDYNGNSRPFFDPNGIYGG